MMRTQALLLRFCWVAAVALLLADPMAAQSTPADNAVSGSVADSTGAPLPGAHVLLVGAGDALAGFGTTRPDGTFQISDVAAGAYRLQATFIGYETREIPLDVAGEPVDVGTVRLAEAVGELGQLVVSGDRPPVVMRGDTVVYAASDYEVREGARVEDLLRKLPGVEVDADGTVRANGEVVRDVLVDGKEFFGGTPTIATQNLPADAVERVEVFRRQSEAAEFTGVNDGRGQTALNLALKEGHKNGLFGSATSGAGSATPRDGRLRYQGRALVNAFGRSTRLSTLGRANNVNRAALSIREYLTLMPRPKGGASDSAPIKLSDALPLEERGWEGFSTTSLLGANGLYDAERGPEVQATYLGYRVRTERDGQAVRDQVAGDAAFREREDADRLQTLDAHRLTLDADHDFGEAHDLQAHTDLSWSRDRDGTQAQVERREPDGALASTAAATTVEEARGLKGEARLTYRRRLGAGRRMVAEVGAASHTVDEDDEVTSDNAFFDTEAPIQERISEAYQRRAADGSAWLDVRATQTLGARRLIQLQADLRQRRQHLDQQSTRGDAATIEDGAAEVRHTRARLGLTYRDQIGRADVALGLAGEWLDAEAPSLSGAVTEPQTRLLPSARFVYTMGQNRRIEADYRTATREPDVTALQPFSSRRGPFETYAGNPALRPEYAHDLDLRYLHFDAFTLRSILVFARLSYTHRAFSSSRSIDDDFRQQVRPLNVDGAWSAFGSASYGTPMRALKGSVKVSASMRYRQTTERLNGLDNAITVLGGSVGAEYQNRTPEPVDVRAGLRLEYSAASYALRPATGRTVSYLTPRAEIGWYPGWRLELRTRAEHRLRLARAQDEQLLIPLWDVEAAMGVGPRTRLRLSVTDLLGRSRSIRYDETAAYVEQRTTRTLGRYALLSLEHDF